jgi:hypothetical protein
MVKKKTAKKQEENILDLDVLNASASFRRKDSSNEKAVFKPEWKCEYCGKVLSNETYFMRHTCKEQTRSEELSTTIGQAAYFFYCEWMSMYKRKPPSIDTFATSRFYTSFLEFAKHVKKLKISNTTKFIEIMKDKDISPMLWRRDQCYSMYLEWMDKKQDPLDQVQGSIETLFDISDKEDVHEIGKIFDHLGVRRIIDLVKLRKLSPWFLFCSRAFSTFLKNIPREDTIELSAVINPNFWTVKLQDNKEIVKDIMKINTEMGL